MFHIVILITVLALYARLKILFGKRCSSISLVESNLLINFDKHIILIPNEHNVGCHLVGNLGFFNSSYVIINS